MKTIKASETSKKIASNTVYQIIGKFVTMSITILITVMVTRAFGRSGYGEFNLMQAFPALFFVVADFGFNAIATRELSADWRRASEYFGNILSIRIVLSIVLILLSILALLFFPYSNLLKMGISISLLLILTQGLFATTNIIFQVKLRYDYSTIGLIVGSFVILILAVSTSLLKLDVMWVSFSYVIGGLVTFLINLRFIKSFGLSVSLSFDRELWKTLFLQALPLGLMFVFSQINFKSDSLLLSVLPVPPSLKLTNTETVAIYGLPYKIFEVSLVIPTFFMNSVYPVFIRHMNESKEKLLATFKKVMIALLVGGVIVSVVSILLAPLLINILGGAQFSQSIILLRILMVGVFIFYVTQPVAWLIVTLGKQIYLPYVYFVSAFFNLGLNYVFIPKYSFYASSVLTWVSEILILVMLVYFAKRAWVRKYA